jgi:hypothetical protein
MNLSACVYLRSVAIIIATGLVWHKLDGETAAIVWLLAESMAPAVICGFIKGRMP